MHLVAGNEENSSKLVTEFLTELIDSEGIPKELKVDNDTAFKSNVLKNLRISGRSRYFIRLPIGLVERNLRTIQSKQCEDLPRRREQFENVS